MLFEMIQGLKKNWPLFPEVVEWAWSGGPESADYPQTPAGAAVSDPSASPTTTYTIQTL